VALNQSAAVTGTLAVANGGGTNASAAGVTALNNITGRSGTGFTGTSGSEWVQSDSPTLTGSLTLANATTQFSTIYVTMDPSVTNDAAGFALTNDNATKDFFIYVFNSAHGGNIGFGTSKNQPISFYTNNQVRMTVPAGGGIELAESNFKIGGTADRATTAGTNQLVLFDGTAPVGTLSNGISLYSASGECRVMDAAGNSTLLSPHDRETNEWIYHSIDTHRDRRDADGKNKALAIEVERILRAINACFGWDFVHEYAWDHETDDVSSETWRRWRSWHAAL
jgi:hypothetical protein